MGFSEVDAFTLRLKWQTSSAETLGIKEGSVRQASIMLGPFSPSVAANRKIQDGTRKVQEAPAPQTLISRPQRSAWSSQLLDPLWQIAPVEALGQRRTSLSLEIEAMRSRGRKAAVSPIFNKGPQAGHKSRVLNNTTVGAPAPLPSCWRSAGTFGRRSCLPGSCGTCATGTAV